MARRAQHLVSRCDPFRGGAATLRVAGAPEGCRFAAAGPKYNVRQAAAKRQPCGAPATRSVAAQLAWGPQALLLKQRREGNVERSRAARQGAAASPPPDFSKMNFKFLKWVTTCDKSHTARQVSTRQLPASESFR